MNYEGIVIRPPSEANSIILQVTVGCSHNRCTFCGTYKDVKFRIKPDRVVNQDIEFASQVCKSQTRVFLADGDVLCLSQQQLCSLFQRISSGLGSMKRISLYGSGASIRNKSISELIELKNLGLDRIYLGVESGDNQLLSTICKGETAESLLEAGRRVREADIFLSTSIILGLGGIQRSRQHATATAALLNQIKPNQIGALTLMVLGNTPLATQIEDGTFHPLDSTGSLQELRMLLSALTLDRVQFMANHSSNYLPLSGRLSRDKDRLLSLVDQAIEQGTELVAEDMRSL